MSFDRGNSRKKIRVIILCSFHYQEQQTERIMKTSITGLTGAVLVLVFLSVGSLTVNGQTKAAKTSSGATAGAAVTEATQSLGVGLESRFNSGSKPIEIDRVNITPGTPMTVKPTMDNMISKEGTTSFGGILGRYDTTNFGKFFASGGLAAQQAAARKAKDPALTLGDNVVDNSDAKIPRMYPPRLYIDPAEFPVTTDATRQVRLNVISQVKNMLTRFGTDSRREQVELVFQGDSVILQGQIRLKDQSLALENVLALEPGVGRVENRLVVLEPGDGLVDLLGQPVQPDRSAPLALPDSK